MGGVAGWATGASAECCLLISLGEGDFKILNVFLWLSPDGLSVCAKIRHRCDVSGGRGNCCMGLSGVDRVLKNVCVGNVFAVNVAA